MTNAPSDAGWHPISTAPRDGTEVELMNQGDGEVWRMRWHLLPVRLGGGIWAMCGFAGGVLSTWSETDPECPPTHWRPAGPKPPLVEQVNRVIRKLEKVMP